MSLAKHRIGQGVRALLAIATPVNIQLAEQYLTAIEFAAFCAMSRAEQLHSLRALQEVLKQQDSTPRVLAASALLHDVGKSRYHLAVWQKTMCVIVTAVMPSLARQLGKNEGKSVLRAPFAVRQHHARWGRDILRYCQSEDEVEWLVENHQGLSESYRDHPCYSLLQRLQMADDAC